MNLEEYVVVMVVFLLVVPASIISTARHNVYERVSCNRRQIETLPLRPLLYSLYLLILSIKLLSYCRTPSLDFIECSAVQFISKGKTWGIMQQNNIAKVPQPADTVLLTVPWEDFKVELGSDGGRQKYIIYIRVVELVIV